MLKESHMKMARGQGSNGKSERKTDGSIMRVGEREKEGHGQANSERPFIDHQRRMGRFDK